MDTWMGRNAAPQTLHKYVYVHADPVNGTDPSGNATVGSLVANGVALLAVVSAVTVATNHYFGDGSIAEGTGDRRPTVWDAVMLSLMVSNVHFGVDAVPLKIQKRNPEERHHTIPISMCGADDQRLSSLSLKNHHVIHRGIAGVELTIKLAGGIADRVVRVSRHRQPYIMRLARTESGRGGIVGALRMFYTTFGWMDEGRHSPEWTYRIGDAFDHEAKEFINGKTSLDNSCVRRSRAG